MSCCRFHYKWILCTQFTQSTHPPTHPPTHPFKQPNSCLLVGRYLLSLSLQQPRFSHRTKKPTTHPPTHQPTNQPTNQQKTTVFFPPPPFTI